MAQPTSPGRRIASKKTLLMELRWHGSTVVGKTIEEMFHRAYSIEENARLLWQASVMGDIVPVPKEVSFDRPPTANTRTLNYFANLERPAEEQHYDTEQDSFVQFQAAKQP